MIVAESGKKLKGKNTWRQYSLAHTIPMKERKEEWLKEGSGSSGDAY